MEFRKILLALTFICASSSLIANGLMMPIEEGYPKDFLRNTVTKVDVNFYGLIAETVVYQEFKNEWYDSTDVVWSFPLPPDARATEFIYWYKDTVYAAVLKVKQQAVNPGTGDGTVAGLVNKYIGRNGLKISLKGVQPQKVQRIQLRYISICDYYNGKVNYEFPLNTSDFVDYPLDDLEFNISVESNTPIIHYQSATHEGLRKVSESTNSLSLKLSEPKAYLNTNFSFSYETTNNELDVDFYSIGNDTTDGHFALFVRPQNDAHADSVHPRRVYFLLSQSNSMYGYKFEQSRNAIKYALDKLNSKDLFNIVVYGNYISTWQNNPVQYNAEAASIAKSFLDNLTPNSYGARLEQGIEECLVQTTDDNYNNVIYLFTDGRSAIDPEDIEQLNNYYTGIFPIGIGANLFRSQLEMTAALNYGFVTYIDDTDNMYNKVTQLMDETAKPLLKQVAMEVGGASTSNLLPAKAPSTYAGGMFYMTGRYANGGQSVLSIAGNTVSGTTAYNFQLDFAEGRNRYRIAEYLWAKMMIDALEWEIEVYTEREDQLKDLLIELSLKYNIRCRFTAYIADYETPVTSISEIENKNELVPSTFLVGNYPNPFNPTTSIRFYINEDDAGVAKIIKIYNMLGQLVAVIDISAYGAGWQEVIFNGRDMFGNSLSSGIYLVQFLVKDKSVNTIKINLLK
jgi:hypothetical protein